MIPGQFSPVTAALYLSTLLVGKADGDVFLKTAILTLLPQ